MLVVDNRYACGAHTNTDNKWGSMSHTTFMSAAHDQHAELLYHILKEFY